MTTPNQSLMMKGRYAKLLDAEPRAPSRRMSLRKWKRCTTPSEKPTRQRNEQL